ncbi:Zinc finger BED domain-containing protein 4 [Eumeta japonica]|uniref:Zinc finger BED domain-containing protein 4 n=1 Tax=Eumeta variegata TaxID=151549 RepID=A0A4C1SWS4_EUMVA|nr:Zinc finger BED domain-containing protein 4 [Eumeta japonica]
MVRAMQLSGFEDISCAIHQIQLCIRAGVESQEWLLQLIAKLKKIATHFNHSLVAQAELTKIQKERLNQSPLSVIQDCPTRWNSTFYMMERFSKLKDSLVLYLSANPIAMISPEDWMNIQKFVQLMQPFEEITRNLSSSQISISSVIPLIQVLKTTLQQEETKPNTSEQFINFITKLRDELNSNVRFGNLVEDDKYTIATYLDPRYKSHFFTSVIAEQVESKLLNMTINTIRTRQSNSIQDDDCEPSPKRSRTQIAIEDIEVQPSTSKSSASLQILESMLSVNEDQEEDSSTADDGNNLLLKIQSHLREYKKEKRLPLYEDPLMWWNGNAHKYPHILPIVRQYLSAPPSSVASEQLFSGAGLIYEEHRNRLKDDVRFDCNKDVNVCGPLTAFLRAKRTREQRESRRSPPPMNLRNRRAVARENVITSNIVVEYDCNGIIAGVKAKVYDSDTVLCPTCARAATKKPDKCE